MRGQQRPPGLGEAVEDDLAGASRVRDFGGAQRTQVMADEILGLAGDPREIARRTARRPRARPARATDASGDRAPSRAPLPLQHGRLGGCWRIALA
jgi:hypothetical protein